MWNVRGSAKTGLVFRLGRLVTADAEVPFMETKLRVLEGVILYWLGTEEAATTAYWKAGLIIQA